MQLKLRKFDPSQMPDNSVCIFVARRRGGKSFLMRDILYHKKALEYGIIMSGTEAQNNWYKQFCPDLFIHNDYSANALENLIKHQRKRFRKGEGKSCFLVLDDVIHNSKIICKDTNIRYTILNGRHIGLFTCIASQYIYSLGPEIRANCDYIFLCKENNHQNRQKLYNSFAGFFPTFESF